MATAPNTPQNLDFAQLMPKVAARLLGKPNAGLSKGSRLRYGTHGSLEVDTAEGWFRDYELGGEDSATRGGTLDLIQRELNCGRAGALTWLEEQGMKDTDRDAAPRAAQAKVFYDYRDATGAIAFRVERRGKGMSPPFLQHGPDGKGGFHSARGCMQGVPRLPYRLPELLGADPQGIVFVCEGEKDADRLASGGLIATTNPGGAGKFTADLAAHLEGRRVVALEDNDDAGAAHVASVLATLGGVAAQAVALKLPDLPPKGDVSDWLDANSSLGRNSVFDLVKLAEAALTTEAKPADIFPIADLTLWAQTQPTPKAFVMSPYIPRDDVVIITGDGGTNKSTLALQISACAAAAKPMLGMQIVPGPALYITAEDDQRENHWRLDKIASAIGTSVDQLAGRLHIVSLRGRLNNELATFDNDGKLRPSPAYMTLRATIEHTGAKLVTLDNVAHLFAGNENDRSNVTGFVNLLYQLCGDFGVTILLIAHRNKAGDSYSGSTAWLNAVRSQLLIERSDEHDADARRLSLGKANYARQGEACEFRWHDFALVREGDLSENTRAEYAAIARATADNEAFLACLRERAKQGDGRAVGPSPGPNYAPTQFMGDPRAKGLGKDRLKAAMDRLFATGVIESHTYRNKAKGRDVTIIREAWNYLSPDPEPLPRTPPEHSSRTTPNSTPELPRAHSLPLKGDGAAALEASAAPTQGDTQASSFGGIGKSWADYSSTDPDDVEI